MTIPHYLVLLDENGVALHTYQLMSPKRDSRDNFSGTSNDEKASPAESTDDAHGRNSPALYNELTAICSRPATPQGNRNVTPLPPNVNPPTKPRKIPDPDRDYAWLATVHTVWKKHYPSGHFPKGSGRDLKPLIKAVGEAELGRRLDAYLTSTGAEYINLAKFARTSDAWARKVRVPPPTTDLDAYEQAMRGADR